MQPAQQNYLETEILTAAPQKLQLMLIDSALRSATRAKECWAEDNHAGAAESLIHAQEIVGEMLAGVNPEVAPEITKKVASLYLFIFRSLMEATHNRDEEKLDDAIRVLEIERETWRQVCEKLGTLAGPETTTGPAPEQPEEETAQAPEGGFSLEA